VKELKSEEVKEFFSMNNEQWPVKNENFPTPKSQLPNPKKANG